MNYLPSGLRGIGGLARVVAGLPWGFGATCGRGDGCSAGVIGGGGGGDVGGSFRTLRVFGFIPSSIFTVIKFRIQ